MWVQMSSDVRGGVQSVNHSSGVQRCFECGYPAVPDDPQDRRDHRFIHRRRVKAYQALGYRPAGSTKREEIKFEGEQLIRAARTAEEIVAGAELFLKGLYDRSLEASIDRGDYMRHPSAAQFTAMICLETSGVAAAAALLRRKYGWLRPTGDFYGGVYWRPWPSIEVESPALASAPPGAAGASGTAS